MNFDNIPQELKELNQWVVWKLEPSKHGIIKKTKVPYNPKTGKKAKAGKPQTWGSYEQALKTFQSGEYSGIGFQFTKEDPYCGIDFDHCIDTETGENTATGWIELWGSYTELSQSGTGIHVIGKAKAEKGRKKGNYEIYDCNRFFALTGRIIGKREIKEIDIQPFYEKYFGEATNDANTSPNFENEICPDEYTPEQIDEILFEAFTAKNAEKLSAVWHFNGWEKHFPSTSEASLYLCNQLRFWFGRNIEVLWEIYQMSEFYINYRDADRRAYEYDIPKAVKDGVVCNRLTKKSEAKKASSGFNFVIGSDILNMVFEGDVMMVPDIFTIGLNVFAGKPKLGKSWAALDVAIALDCGGMALGTVKVDKRKVLYLALEDGDKRLQDRLEKLQAPSNTGIAFVKESDPGSNVEKLRKTIEDHGFEVIIIDTLECFRKSITNGNKSAYSNDYEAAREIQRMAIDLKVCIIVLHHTTKANYEDPFDCISGTYGLIGAADTLIVMMRKPDSKTEAYLHVRGRDIESNTFILDKNQGVGWTLTGKEEDEDVSTISLEKQLIINAIKAAGKALSPKEIAIKIGKTVDSVKMLLVKMLKEKLVMKAGYGKYILYYDTQEAEDDLLR